MITFVTNGDESIHNKTKVMLIYDYMDNAQKGDSIQCLLTEDIKNASDDIAVCCCAISVLTNLEALSTQIDEIDAIVACLTSGFLASEKCMETIKYILRKGVPLLPYCMELSCMKNLGEILGDIQVINACSNDKTEIAPDLKFREWLRNLHRVTKEKRLEIEASFRKRVFLSYRKKDRIFVEKIERVIHENEAFEDVAIWYDESLTAGENFNEEIQREIDRCDAAILLITPSILEPNEFGEMNYVEKYEFPELHSKTNIVPIMAKETEMMSLYERFGLEGYVILEDKEAIYASIAAVLKMVDNCEETRPKDERKEYCLGMAYYMGILVEKDVEHAKKLLSLASQNGILDATAMMSEITANRITDERSIKEAVYWQERYVNHLCMQASSVIEVKTIVTEWKKLIELYVRMGDSNSVYEKTCNLDEWFQNVKNRLELTRPNVSTQAENLWRYLEAKVLSIYAINLFRTKGKIKEGCELLDKAWLLYSAVENISDQREMMMSAIEDRDTYVEFNLRMGRFSSGKKAAIDIVELLDKISTNKDDERVVFELGNAYLRCAEICLEIGDYKEGIDYGNTTCSAIMPYMEKYSVSYRLHFLYARARNVLCELFIKWRTDATFEMINSVAEETYKDAMNAILYLAEKNNNYELTREEGIARYNKWQFCAPEEMQKVLEMAYRCQEWVHNKTKDRRNFIYFLKTIDLMIHSYLTSRYFEMENRARELASLGLELIAHYSGSSSDYQITTEKINLLTYLGIIYLRNRDGERAEQCMADAHDIGMNMETISERSARFDEVMYENCKFLAELYLQFNLSEPAKQMQIEALKYKR